MQFSPKTHERYRAALRMYMQRQLIRHGISGSICKRIKSVLTSELVFSSGRHVPTDPIMFADSVLGAAVMRLMRNGKRLSVTLSGTGCIYEDRGLLAALLLQSAAVAVKDGGGEVSVNFTGCDISISFAGTPDRLLRILTRKLDGVCATVLPDNHTSILLPGRKAARNTAPITDEWEYLLDPLSIVNIMLAQYEKD